MKKLSILLLLVLSFFLLTSCSQEISNATDTEISSNGLASIIIDPQEVSLKDSQTVSSQNNELTSNTTHIGTRIEYPGKKAYFVESVEIDQATEKGIITFSIPATKDANIYVAAVNYDNNKTLYYGIKRGINIQKDTLTEIKTKDFDWVQADWKYGDGNQILVRDPFRQKDNRYDEYFIGINGSSSISDDFTEDGFRIYYDAEGEPFLKHIFFNLPFKSRYLIDQTGN